MGSSRYPGKVLAPFRGEPIIQHVVRAVGAAVGPEAVVVATTDSTSDDPLVAYLDTLGVRSFRGPADDVYERFRRCLAAHPAEWVLRVGSDSPLLPPPVVRRVVEAADDPGLDLVSTIVVRTYRHGENAELVRAASLLALADEDLTADDREHVTAFFYRHPQRFSIKSIEAPTPAAAGTSIAVDTVDDLVRLEAR